MMPFGNFGYAAGASGTVTLPEGAVVVQIYARSTAGGSVAIFGGTAIPIVATTDFYRHPAGHALMISKDGADAIVFTTTTSYYVEYLYP